MGYLPKALFTTEKPKEEPRLDYGAACSGVMWSPTPLFATGIRTTGSPIGPIATTGSWFPTNVHVAVTGNPRALFEKSHISGNGGGGGYTPLFANAKPAAPKPTSPSPLFADAKVRHRIEVSLSDLQYPATPETLRAAHHLVVSLNLDLLDPRYVLDWGSAPQSAHQAILNTLLDSALDKDATEAKTLILEIVDKLDDIDFAALGKTGLFSGSRESKVARITATLAKIRTASDALLAGLPTLKGDWQALVDLTPKLDAAETALDPFIIACDFFSRYQRPGFPNELFIARLTSLAGTKVSIAQNRQQRAMLAANILALIDTIQGTIRGEIPMWQSACITCLTSRADHASVASDKQSLLTRLKRAI